MPWNAVMMPTTVPSSPTNGAVDPIVASAGHALLQVVRRQRRGALDRAAHGVDEVLAAQVRARFLLELIFLQTGEDDLRQMAVAVILRGGHRNRVLQPPVLQVLRHLRRVLLGLLAGLVERVDALDRDAERPHGHDDQDDSDGLRHPSHLVPHVNKIHSAFHRNPPKRRPPACRLDDCGYCRVKLTVTVMMTGTGTPFRSVGVNSHCLTASRAA